jgi:two-component sensor histidine kinase
VKNNLQIIIAFLSMKMREGSQDITEKLTSVISRVQAISLAHDLLSTGQHGNSSVDFAVFGPYAAILIPGYSGRSATSSNSNRPCRACRACREEAGRKFDQVRVR